MHLSGMQIVCLLASNHTVVLSVRKSFGDLCREDKLQKIETPPEIFLDDLGVSMDGLRLGRH